MSNQFELTRRKALAGIAGVGAISAGAGLQTSAFFSDREPFENNQLVAGQLDLRIDWQQLYFGPEENTDHYAPYGTAGYPYVNAHPDHDVTGEQSLDSDDFDSVEDDGVVRYSDNDANIQAYLNCETLENFAEPESFENGVSTQESLIELEDVKPGDCGEVTFSLHLCDNPGYLWWIAQIGTFDEALAKAIKVTAWYDLNCTNRFEEDDGDRILVETTDLYTFLEERLSPDGRRLSPEPYGEGIIPESLESASGSGEGSEGGDENEDGDGPCLFLDKIDFGDEAITVDGDGMLLKETIVERSEEGELREQLAFVLLLTDPDSDIEIVLQVSELVQKTNDSEEILREKGTYEGEVIEFDWDILQSYTVGDTQYVSSDVGICQTGLRAGPPQDPGGGAEFILKPKDECTLGETNVTSPTEVGPPSGTPGGGGPGQGGGLAAFSAVEFYYCADLEVPPPSLCFPAEKTFCVAFKWCLPTTTPEHVDDINELQGKSMSFDLGFYTEQCRHNPEPSGPSGF